MLGTQRYTSHVILIIFGSLTITKPFIKLNKVYLIMALAGHVTELK